MKGAFQTIRAIAAIMLLAALMPLPENYQDTVRYFVCMAALLEIIHTLRARFSFGTTLCWIFTFSVIIVIFNPFYELQMARQAWIYLDLLAAAFFAFVIAGDVFSRPQGG